MKSLFGVLLVIPVLSFQVALAADSCINISGCYLNSEESQGALQSLIKIDSGCWGANYSIGKVFKTGEKLLILPDRSFLNYRVSSEKQDRPYGMGSFRIAVDANAVTLTETIYSPPMPEFEQVTRSTVVEAGGQACGKTVSMRTLVEESGSADGTACRAYPAVAPELCQSLVYYTSNRTIARCEGRGTLYESEGKTKPFSYKAYLVEDGVGKISTRVFRDSADGNFAINVYGPMSFSAQLDPEKGLVMNLVAFSNSEWYGGYPMILDPLTLKTNRVKAEGNAGGGPGYPFDTIQCRFDPEGFNP